VWSTQLALAHSSCDGAGEVLGRQPDGPRGAFVEAEHLPAAAEGERGGRERG
jgi:hypothetical protein